ncbi:LytR cell envelope-related transcriptional attenuator [Rhodococcus triatomae]|uniref:LytR cell envelope-related transcriptional attenuator n=2 Tax=Rhodococcus triatomae TaxID=300028 RepID=A0A1G8NCP3_9NOCA|nr:LytR cell envelope-related transcriptional attenuator [Rhodococcus triatomae]
MLLISLAVVFAGLGFASLGSSGSGDAAPATETTTTTTDAPAAAPPPAAAGAGAAEPDADSDAAAATTTTPTMTATAANGSLTAEVPVRVFNNSAVTGLAAQTAQELITAGWTVAETGNYSDGTIAETAVYYGNSAAERQAAEQIADELGVPAKPRFAGISSSSPGVVVIVTAD